MVAAAAAAHTANAAAARAAAQAAGRRAIAGATGCAAAGAPRKKAQAAAGAATGATAAAAATTAAAGVGKRKSAQAAGSPQPGRGGGRSRGRGRQQPDDGSSRRRTGKGQQLQQQQQQARRRPDSTACQKPKQRQQQQRRQQAAPQKRRKTSADRKAEAPPEKRRKSSADRKGGAGKEAEQLSITETARILSDSDVALALSSFVYKSQSTVLALMRRWRKPILKAPIPGVAYKRPTQEMLQAAKVAVLKFYAREQALGPRSDIVKAFLLASGEPALRFDWPTAMARVRRARFDNRQEIDPWTECFAMSSGDSNSVAEIYVCGTKRVTLRALTSLLCHEGLHNFARRVRPGNSFLSEDLEHIAMALIGDPQLVHDDAGRSGVA